VIRFSFPYIIRGYFTDANPVARDAVREGLEIIERTIIRIRIIRIPSSVEIDPARSRTRNSGTGSTYILAEISKILQVLQNPAPNPL